MGGGGGQVYLYWNVCGESLQLIDNVRLLFCSITDALHIVENTCQALSEKKTKYHFLSLLRLPFPYMSHVRLWP
jgi:hypothetical protein